MKTLKEINARKVEIRSILESNADCNIDELEKELRELDEKAQAIEKRAELARQIGASEIVANEIVVPQQKEERSFGVDSKEYRSAFYKNLAGVELNEVEQRAMTTNSNSAGVAVPTTTMNKIFEKIENDSVVYGLVTVSHLRGNVVIPIEKNTGDVQRKAEGEGGTVVDDTLDELRLGAKKYIKLVQLTCELENTSIDALESYIVAKLSKKLAQAFDYDIINGTGVKGAKGILADIEVAETTTSTKWTFDDVCTLFAGINATARKSATLMMSTDTLYKQSKTIKDEDKRPIFDPSSNKVLGRDVVECDDDPNGTIIFGDFSEYMFNWNKEAVIDKSGEVEFKKGDSVYRILALCDGGLADLGAMTSMTSSSSGSGS